jgi:alpha-N-arabinofuranosidase
MTAFNSFEKQETVKPVAFKGFKMKESIVTVTLPPKSVVVIELAK